MKTEWENVASRYKNSKTAISQGKSNDKRQVLANLNWKQKVSISQQVALTSYLILQTFIITFRYSNGEIEVA